MLKTGIDSVENRDAVESQECICTKPGYCPMMDAEVGPVKLQKCQESESFRKIFHQNQNSTSSAQPLTRHQHLRRLIGKQNGFTVRDTLVRTCQHLGTIKHQEPCSCGSQSKIAIHDCHHPDIPIGCVPRGQQHSLILDKDAQKAVTCCESCEQFSTTPRFISQRQLDCDIKNLIAKIPSSVTRIAGVARSGIPVAGKIANYLHLPIDIVRQSEKDVISAGHGWRLNGHKEPSDDHVLVVDDTCMTGNSLKDVQPVVEDHYKNSKIEYACVYVNPLANQKPDIWSADLPQSLILWGIVRHLSITLAVK